MVKHASGRLRCWLALALLAVTAALIESVGATPVQGLYDVSVPVENRSDKVRDAAFSDAMVAVAVRVTGQRGAGQKLVQALPQARKYVQRYGYPAAGTLEVGFDPNSIDQALSAAGLPLWGRERPATLICLAVDDGQRQWLTGSGSGAADLVNKAATDRGVPVVWPAMDREEQSKLDAMLASGANPAELAQIMSRYKANAVLLGRTRGGATRWQLLYNGQAAEANGSLEDGIHLAADTFASVFAVTANTINSVELEIAGMANLDAYAQTLNYLEGLTLVRNVAVEHVQGDTVQFRVAVRGDATTLERALQLDNRFAVSSGSPGTPPSSRLTLRYQP
jgi:hypothetical protein